MKSVLLAAMAVGAGIALSPSASAEPSWTMPNLIGMDLQGAQDAIQSLTRGEVWFSSSTDLTGKGRAQISDRNWQVCSSTPPPGAKFNADTKIDFSGADRHRGLPLMFIPPLDVAVENYAAA